MKINEIMPALFAGLGLNFAPTLGSSPHGREVLFLIDGFGANALVDFPELIPNILSGKNFGQLQSNFPSTTATSLTSLMTGKMPNQHGMVGYTMRIPNSDNRILHPLKWDERVDPTIWQPNETFFEIGARHGINVTHVAAKRYEGTGFTRASFRGAHYRGANIYPDLVAETVAALSKTPALVYLYVNDLDVAGHTQGYGSDRWIEALRMIDNLVEQLRNQLPIGTRLWITADHGMLNVGEKIVIGRDNLLATELLLIAGEPRARHLYLKRPELADEVANLWRSELGDRVSVYTRDGAVSSDLFGSPVNPLFMERIGDIVAVVNDDSILVNPEREKLESAMKGHHGAMSNIETEIPLYQIYS